MEQVPSTSLGCSSKYMMSRARYNSRSRNRISAVKARASEGKYTGSTKLALRNTASQVTPETPSHHAMFPISRPLNSNQAVLWSFGGRGGTRDPERAKGLSEWDPRLLTSSAGVLSFSSILYSAFSRGRTSSFGYGTHHALLDLEEKYCQLN